MKDIPEEREVFVRASRIRADGLVWHLLEFVCGEVRGVGDGAQAGDERRLDVADGGPVDTVEERVVLDLIDSEAAVGGRD